jgi:hypothetical protein
MPNATLRLAIQNRKLVKLFYNGGSRVVEPYVFGISGDGKELLRCYQLTGDSEHSFPRGWKLFEVTDIGPISLLKDSFRPRADYHPNDRTLARIFVQI